MDRQTTPSAHGGAGPQCGRGSYTSSRSWSQERRSEGALAKRIFRRIAEGLAGHTHLAATTVAYCGRGVMTHLCRAATPALPIIADVDTTLARTAADVYGVPHDEPVLAQLQLRYTEGGFGYRATAPYARRAFLASVVESAKLQDELAPHLVRGRHILARDTDVIGAHRDMSEPDYGLNPNIPQLIEDTVAGRYVSHYVIHDAGGATRGDDRSTVPVRERPDSRRGASRRRGPPSWTKRRGRHVSTGQEGTPP